MRIAARCIIAAGLMVSALAARAEGIIPPQVITVTPDTVDGDSTQTVSVCIGDLTAPSYIGWRINNFPGGLTGSLNGVATQGYIGPRESDGCVHNVSVLTQALPPTLTYSPQFLFHAAGQFLTYDGILYVQVPDMQVSVQPSRIVGNGSFNVTVGLTSTVSTDQIPVVLANCHGTLGISAYPPVAYTNSTGHASFTVTVSAADIAQPGTFIPSGTCLAKTTTGQNSATLTIAGTNACAYGYSPPDPRCGNPSQ